MKLIFYFVLLTMLVFAGCDANEQPAAPDESAGAPGGAAIPPTTTEARSTKPRVVFLGDSLTAGYGVERDEAYPVIVAQMLKSDGLDIDAVNAGVSGDTTAGGLRRLDWVLKQKPDILVVALGGNDGLRGLDLRESEENLRQIITKSRAAGTQILLLGMMIPPNYGPDYTKRFQEIYPKLAKELNVPLVPFLLKDVGGEAKFNQRDGIHPTPQGHKIVAKNVEPRLRDLVRALPPKP
jgi:acyl-CoA thioesterase I